MNKETQARLHSLIKLRMRQAVYVHLSKSKWDFYKEFLEEVRTLEGDAEIRIEEMQDFTTFIYFETRPRGDVKAKSKSEELDPADFGTPHFIAFVKFCNDALDRSPKNCAIFVHERIAEVLSKTAGGVMDKMRVVQWRRGELKSLQDNKRAEDSDYYLSYVDNMLSDYIKEFLA